MTRILITGAAGMVGRNLLEHPGDNIGLKRSCQRRACDPIGPQPIHLKL